MTTNLFKTLPIFTCVFLLLLGCAAKSVQAEVGFLGLEIQGFDQKISKLLGQINQSGVLVKNVAVGEAGAIAGFRRGDLIVEFNGVKIKNLEALLKAVAKTKIGQKIPVIVLRHNRKVKLGLKSHRRPASWQKVSGSFAKYPAIGITVAAITQKIRERFSLRWDSRGIVVTLVDAKSKIVATGLQPGDVIVQANLHEIWQPAQFTKIIAAAQKAGRSGILILIESAKGFRYSLLPLKN